MHFNNGGGEAEEKVLQVRQVEHEKNFKGTVPHSENMLSYSKSEQEIQSGFILVHPADTNWDWLIGTSDRTSWFCSRRKTLKITTDSCNIDDNKNTALE